MIGARARIVAEIAEMRDQTGNHHTVEEMADRLIDLWMLFVEAADIVEWRPSDYPSQDCMAWTDKGDQWKKVIKEN